MSVYDFEHWLLGVPYLTIHIEKEHYVKMNV